MQALRSHGLLLSDYVASGIDRGVMLVPDGVAELTLGHFQLLAPHAARLSQIPPTTSTVTDNFALLQITGLTEQNLHLNPHTLGPYYHDASGQGCRTHLRDLLATRDRPDDFAQPRAHTDPPHHHQPPARRRHPPPSSRNVPSSPARRAACQAH